MKAPDHYPIWICLDCGIKYGKRPCGAATWHEGICEICNQNKQITEPRDFGHLKPFWKKEFDLTHEN